ncbi:MAG TPA: transposase [Terriglobales bacterium]|jgi:REP element-mobilizing transposase RayT|nr:transposase [Terriglobales bacterium]
MTRVLWESNRSIQSGRWSQSVGGCSGSTGGGSRWVNRSAATDARYAPADSVATAVGTARRLSCQVVAWCYTASRAAAAARRNMSADLPLAYLITFRCYGTWLHGDERGATDRHHNQYGAAFIPSNDRWHGYNVRRLKQAPVSLSDAQRKCVEAAIRETCDFHDWTVLAINVRTNHAHSLIASATTQPSRVLNALKAHSTQRLRDASLWRSLNSPWSERGGKRYIWTELGIGRAKEYVINDQDGPIPELDEPRRRSRGVGRGTADRRQ